MTTSPKRIALIIASTRTPRLGPAIATIAAEIIIPRLPPHWTLDLVDLMQHPLPLFTADPIIPAGLRQPVAADAYADPATNAWSALVRAHDAFVFLTPQYNWGYPAPLKLALDALYHEWAAKPALVLSYGARGGNKAAAQLRQVLEGLHMRVCARGVQLPFGKGHDLGGGVISKETDARWRAEDKKEEVIAAWEELVGLVNAVAPVADAPSHAHAPSAPAPAAATPAPPAADESSDPSKTGDRKAKPLDKLAAVFQRSTHRPPRDH
ncbi:flavoprotein-like protein [Mycena maculata]|uniref:Flavoprotein-like protein n=1 Tax=Mycena maculata TaxID=230809 RepID=A0AAD7HQS0_9AGAR|nr:flavoprotein-like protein [Mycena maculata]